MNLREGEKGKRKTIQTNMKERILNGTKLVPSHPEELTQIYSISRLLTYNKTDLFKCVFQ